MHQAEIIVVLFAAVAALAVVAGRRALPYPIVLVMSGLALSFVPRLPKMRLNPEIVFYFSCRRCKIAHHIFLLSAAYSGSERARMILSDRALGQNCFASEGGIGLF